MYIYVAPCMHFYASCSIIELLDGLPQRRGGRGYRTQKIKRILYQCLKKTKIKKFIRPGRRLLLQHYFYKVPALHTGWRRLIGSPKLQIIFHKRATKYKSLLQKITYKDKGSYESSPPCIVKYHLMGPS